MIRELIKKETGICFRCRCDGCGNALTVAEVIPSSLTTVCLNCGKEYDFDSEPAEVAV